MRLSEALVCFRASGDNFLRSITRAIVNKNDGKRKIDFLMLFLDFQKLSFFSRLWGQLVALYYQGYSKQILESFWDHFGIILK